MIRVWRITRKDIVPLKLADLSTLDAVTRQLPEGYYSTFRTYDGRRRVLGLTEHFRRLFEPVSAPEVDALPLRRRLRALLQTSGPGEARVRAVMTEEGQAYLAIEPLRMLPREIYEQGVRAETIELQRAHPQLKSTAFISASDAEREHIAREGIFEALLVQDGMILEGMTSNFFYVPRADRSAAKSKQAPGEKILCTAANDILPGVTRQTVIEIARGRGVEVRDAPLKRDQLEVAREAFITSSSRGVVPGVQIDQVAVGEGKPGPITQELIPAYDEYVLQHSEEIYMPSTCTVRLLIHLREK